MMASQPSGTDKEDLISLETDEFYFTIKGKNRNFEMNNCDIDRNGYEVTSSSKVSNYSDEKVYFFEYENYEVIIESKDKNKNLEFYNESQYIRDKITKNRSGSLSGIINFGGEIGYSNLEVKVNGIKKLCVRLEIFPSKIDYRKDYINILNDINEEIYNLAFDFLKKTYSLGTLNNEKNTTLTEYHSILQYIYGKLIKAINIIIRNPYHNLTKETSVVPFHKIKNQTIETTKWLEKRPDSFIKKNKKLVPIRALGVNKKVTEDTIENRFLKFIIKKIIFKLKSLRKRYMQIGRKPDEIFIEELNTYIKGLANILNSSFLKNVGEYRYSEISSMVFKMALGYREVYKYYLMLQKGLTLKGDLFKIEIKDLPLLYEYWCFIKLNGILRKRYKLISNDTIKINNNGIFVSLKKGKESRVTYENADTGERFDLFYNSKMKSETVGQKPDNVLSINKNGSKAQYRYIFDAKYKLDRYTHGPKEEDINTMHKYRDAILYEEESSLKPKRSIIGAFVLFPYNNEEEYMKHPFYRSIEKVNIGGIPFLPSTTKLMEMFLDELIKESHFSSFERNLDQYGKEYYIKDTYFKNRNVLVGNLSSKEQLKEIIEHKFYHIPLKNVDLDKHLIKQVAIYQSKAKFKDASGILYYGDVLSYKIMKRKEITEIPVKSGNDDELYIKFNLKSIKKLERKIENGGFPFRKNMYTTEYLLKNARTLSELCIKSFDEFRLWVELVNLNKEVKCFTESSDKENKINGFSFANMDIYFLDGMLKVYSSGILKRKLELNTFRRFPRKFVKEIMKYKN